MSSTLICPQLPRWLLTISMRRGAAAQIAHVPQATPHPLVVGAGGRLHDLSVHQQVDAGLVGMIAAADQEGDVAALDAELRRGERSHGLVALDHGIGVAVALIGPISHSLPCLGPLPKASPVTVQSP